MRVLITRPQPNAEVLAQRLAAVGHEPVVAPVLHIQFSEEPLPEMLSQATLVFTSANGVRFAVARRLTAVAPVYVIGRATRAAAEQAGFRIAWMGDGTGGSLIDHMATGLAQGTRVVHVSGAEVAGDLCGELCARGLSAERFIAYEAKAVVTLPDAARAFLQGPGGAALLLSPRSAAVLATLMRESGLAACAAQHRALALSAAVAQQAQVLSWRALEVASVPEIEALIALL